jgi:glycosyltransferase involved in cell wall biosynthesis
VAAPDLLILIPARDEADSLPELLAELEELRPGAPVLVVDDASEDGSPELLAALGVDHLHLPLRLGVGGALRVGLRVARQRGFLRVVRLDGDGQHPPAVIEPLLAPLESGVADVVVGSRYRMPEGYRTPGLRRLGQHLLAEVLSRWTGWELTDPTSGCWAFGKRAVGLLADHHPGGYPEPELLLFLARNGLRLVEVPVEMRPRRGGRTSFTPAREAAAHLRVLLALLVVPLRTRVEGA